MRVITGLSSAFDGSLRGAALCLGNFDGVHLGHQALLKEASGHGSAALLTFDPHPGKVLNPALAPRMITTYERKLQLLDAYGAHAVVIQPFTKEFAATPPAVFEAMLFDHVGVRHVIVGTDFTYGAKRAGTTETLQRAAEARGALVHLVAPVTVDGVVVSSSRIREYLLEGRIDAASQLLGRPFDVDGVVVKGDGRGRTVGFPTANVQTTNEVQPSSGVYAVRMFVRDRWRGGAANIGTKPTFGGTSVTLEVHLFDFDGDLYGAPVRVQFLERIRAEQRFESVAALVAQITRDVETSRNLVKQFVDRTRGSFDSAPRHS